MKVDRFPDRTRVAVTMRSNGKTYREIASALAVSVTRAMQIIKREETRDADRNSTNPLDHMSVRNANRVRSGKLVRTQ